LSPIALFTRINEAQRMPGRLFADALRKVCQEIYARP
jgi:hypothetical protein